MKTLKTTLMAGLLILVALPLVPTTSAVTCAGRGIPGGEVAELCNEALGIVYGSGSSVDRAERLAEQVVNCATSLTTVALYCIHT